MIRDNIALHDQSTGLLRAGQSVLQRKCGCGNQTITGGMCTKCVNEKTNLQRKLSIGASNDPLEREADRVADQVMAMPGGTNTGKVSPRIQRFTGQSTGQSDSAPVSVDRVLASSGRPMEPVIRQDMEQRFGHDFSQVRVHSGSSAEQSARDVDAHAYTAGHNIVFGAGRFSPETFDGKRLLAHELTHVVQQSNSEGNRFTKSNDRRGPSPVSMNKKIQRTLGDGHDLLAERFQGRLDLEAAFDNERVVQKGSSGPDVVILQLALIDSGHPLPNFGADGDFGSETHSAVVDFQRANGLADDGIVGPRTMEILDGLFTVGPVIAPVCINPGLARTVSLQPVFLRSNAADPDPTGGTFFTQLSKSNEIWSKLGVTFTTSSPVFIDDPIRKRQGATIAELLAIGGLRAGAGIEVFFVDNDLNPFGGGATRIGLGASFIILSDFGTSDTLLAHELGHVLSNSVGHPPANGEAGTIMEPSNSHSTSNPEKNTIGNLAFIVFPAGTDPVCLTPDP